MHCRCQHSNQLCGSTPGGIWQQADGLAAAEAGHYYTRFDDGIYNNIPVCYLIMVDNICTCKTLNLHIHALYLAEL